MHNSFKIKFDEFTSIVTVFIGDFGELSSFAANKFKLKTKKYSATALLVFSFYFLV